MEDVVETLKNPEIVLIEFSSGSLELDPIDQALPLPLLLLLVLVPVLKGSLEVSDFRIETASIVSLLVKRPLGEELLEDDTAVAVGRAMLVVEVEEIEVIELEDEEDEEEAEAIESAGAIAVL